MVINDGVGKNLDERIAISKSCGTSLKSFSDKLAESNYKILFVNYDIENPIGITVFIYDHNTKDSEPKLTHSDIDEMLPKDFEQIPINISYGRVR